MRGRVVSNDRVNVRFEKILHDTTRSGGLEAKGEETVFRLKLSKKSE